MDYEVFKKKIEENKPKLVLAACFVLVFLVGFGVGRFDKNIQKAQKNQVNYNIKSQQQPATIQSLQPAVQTAATTTAASASCVVKGNISSGGKKIYHVAGGAFYKTVKPEQCFNTETEAVAAGYVKSQR